MTRLVLPSDRYEEFREVVSDFAGTSMDGSGFYADWQPDGSREMYRRGCDSSGKRPTPRCPRGRGA